MSKSDKQLGMLVHEYLVKQGVETPITSLVHVSSDAKIEKITELMSDVLSTLGLDLRDDSLVDTPKRVAKMYVNEVFSGLNYDNFPKCTTVQNKFSTSDEFVLERNITLYSDCEHHLRPIIGKVHIAYIPKNHVLGLSKLNRISQFFAQRPQVQERLTQQIAHAISYVAECADVMVVVEASHTCVSQRGIKDTQSSTVTAVCLGKFQTCSDLRREVNANIDRG